MTKELPHISISRVFISKWHKVRYDHRRIFTYRRVKRHTFAKINVGHLMSRKAYFHSVHFMFRADAQNAHPVPRSTARLGAECGVPSAADGPASEVFHDVLQLTQDPGLTTNDFILRLGPEAEIEARQVGAVRRPLMLNLARDRYNGNPYL